MPAAWSGFPAVQQALLQRLPLTASCRTIYLDLGANSGQRIEMLYDVRRCA